MKVCAHKKTSSLFCSAGAVFVLLPSVTFAQVNPVTKTGPAVTAAPQTSPQGTALDVYLGLDFGGVPVRPEDSGNESAKFGYLLGVKGLGSLSLKNAVLDLGGGWFQSRVRSKAAVSAEEGEPTTDVRDIVTRTGFAEASARYKLNPHLEFGPLLTVTFNNDSKFAPLPSKREPNVFLGASLLQSRRESLGSLRWGVNLLTDVNIRGRQVYMINVTAQAGVPLLRPEARVVQVIKEVEKIKIVQAPSEKQNFINNASSPTEIMGQIINFDTARAVLNKNDFAYIQQLSKLLMSSSHKWGSIEITGHADQRGSVQLNEAVSAARAQSAKKILISYGIPAEKITARGRGVSGLVSTTSDSLSLARNRRAEIKIVGVDPESDLEEKVDALRRTYYTPSTCTQLQCR